jgi:hypothetical protein
LALVGEPDGLVRHEPGPCAGLTVGAHLADAVQMRNAGRCSICPDAGVGRVQRSSPRRYGGRRGHESDAAPEEAAPHVPRPRVTAIIPLPVCGQLLSKKCTAAALASCSTPPAPRLHGGGR